MIAAILFVGPKDLPKILHQIGKAFAKIRGYSKDIASGFDAMTEQAALDDILENANRAGDADTEFRIAQQEALDAQKRKKEAGANDEKNA